MAMAVMLAMKIKKIRTAVVVMVTVAAKVGAYLKMRLTK
jgi:hypothetical protein